MPDEPTTLTRNELHQLVWEKPMMRLGEQFGISGNGLAKICRRLEVPYPPRGWWAKKAAGHSVRIMPLPARRAAIPDRVEITPTPEGTNGLKQAVNDRRQRLPDITVPERLARPHPLIAGWLADRRRRNEEARRERDPLMRRVLTEAAFTATDRRRHRILHALFRTLERHGAVISGNDRGQLVATIGGGKVAFELREKLRQIERPLTPEEKRWESWNRSGVKKELEPTGLFLFAIHAWIGQPLRKNWQESEARPMEGLLTEIAATIFVLGPILAEQTRRREEEARAIEERQRQLELERQRQREDNNRWRRFLEIAVGWKKAALAREFIAALRDGDPGANELIEGRSIAEWIDWAEQRADALDAVARQPGQLFEEVGAIRAWTRLD